MNCDVVVAQALFGRFATQGSSERKELEEDTESRIAIEAVLCTFAELLCILALALGSVPIGFGQDSGSNQVQADPSQNDQQPATSAKEPVKQQRLFGIVPTYSMTNIKDAAPLTPGGKFKIFVQNTTDPFTPVGAALVAGVEQANNDFPSFGQGASGYGKRFGTAMADSTVGEFMGTFVFPTILHEDPRYFREGEGPFRKRMGHALSSAFTTRSDAGERRFGWSIVLGELAAGGISNAYYPSQNRGAGLTLSRAAIGIGLGTIGTIFNEFGPDLQRKMSRKKKAPTSTSDQPQH